MFLNFKYQRNHTARLQGQLKHLSELLSLHTGSKVLQKLKKSDLAQLFLTHKHKHGQVKKEDPLILNL